MNLFQRLHIKGWPPEYEYSVLGCLAAGYTPCFIGKPGSHKTAFVVKLAQLAGWSSTVKDCAKLSPDALMGDLNPNYVDFTGKAMDRQTKAKLLSDKFVELEDLGYANLEEFLEEFSTEEIGSQFINSIHTKDIICWDEVRRGDPVQQGLLLNIVQDKMFQGKPVNGIQVLCTNTDFEELFEFNEALLDRCFIFITCPSFTDFQPELQEEFIRSTGHLRPADHIDYDPGFVKEFESLKKVLSTAPSSNPVTTKLDSVVKLFLSHAKYPLAEALGDRLSARAVDRISKTLYVTLATYMFVNKVKYFEDIPMTALEPLIKRTYMSTIYMDDLDTDQKSGVMNSFALAFSYAFNIKELSLLVRLKSVQDFLSNAKDFASHIMLPPEDHDLGGIAVFVDKMKKQCVNNEPLRYILFKWLVHKVSGKGIKIERDIMEPIEKKLASMERKMAKHIRKNAEIKLESSKIGPEFLKQVQTANLNRVFADMPVDDSMYASLITAIQCFDPDKVDPSNDYITDTYNLYAHLRRI